VVQALFVSFILAEGAEQKVGASLTLERTEATVGEKVGARLIAEGPRGVRFEFPPVQTSLDPLSVSDVVMGEEKSDGEKTSREMTFSVAAYKTGKMDVPELVVKYELRGEKGEVKTLPAALSIRSVLKSESEELVDIREPARLPRDYSSLIRVLLISAILIAAAALMIYAVRRYRKRRKIVPLEDIFATIPPHEWAYSELDKLMARKLLEDGLFKDFYVSLMEILKRYLEGRYRIAALERTTEEVMDVMALARIDRKIRASAERILKKSDMVKFARHVPSHEHSREMIQEVYTFIDQTKPAVKNVGIRDSVTVEERK
jgi:hypothetical protein